VGKKRFFNSLKLVFTIYTHFSNSALPKANEYNADRRLRTEERITVAHCTRLRMLTFLCCPWTIRILHLSLTWDADHNQFRNICEFPQTLSSAASQHNPEKIFSLSASPCQMAIKDLFHTESNIGTKGEGAGVVCSEQKITPP
jgi:hypothetical protein